MNHPYSGVTLQNISKRFHQFDFFENKLEWSIFTFYCKTWIIQTFLKIPFIFKVLQTLLFVFLKMMAICTKIQYWEYLISNQILMAMTCYQYTPMIYFWIHLSTSHPPVLWDHLGVPTILSWCFDINMVTRHPVFLHRTINASRIGIPRMRVKKVIISHLPQCFRPSIAPPQ